MWAWGYITETCKEIEYWKAKEKKKTLNKTKQNIQELCDNYKESNIHVIRTGKEREKEKEERFETIMTENFPKLISDTKTTGPGRSENTKQKNTKGKKEPKPTTPRIYHVQNQR